MIRAALRIKCPRCGLEEDVVRTLDDQAVDFNFNKPCPSCHDIWMVKERLSLTPAT